MPLSRADAQNSLHLVPAAQSERVQLVFFDIFVDDDGNFGKRELVAFGHTRKIGVIFEVFELRKHRLVVVFFLSDLIDQFGQIEALHIDAVSLQRHFVEAHRLEGGRARADTAEVKSLHALYHAANGSEVFEVLRERIAQRMHDVRLHHREGNFILIEDVRHRELTAERISSVLEVHLADLIGIRLHEDGNVRILQCRRSAVFVDEDGHTEDDAVVFPFVAFQPVVIKPPLFARFHRAVAGEGCVHRKVLIPRARHSFDHLCACTFDEFPGHKPAVAEIQCKSHIRKTPLTNDITFGTLSTFLRNGPL